MMNMVFRSRFSQALLIILTILCSGCINGPIRYKTIGYRKYATRQWPKEKSNYVKPIYASTGFACDLLIGLGDALAVPIIAIPWTAKVGGPDGKGLAPAVKEYWYDPLVDVFGLFWFSVCYPISLCAIPIWDQRVYEEVFGKEAGENHDVEIKNETPSTGNDNGRNEHRGARNDDRGGTVLSSLRDSD